MVQILIGVFALAIFAVLTYIGASYLGDAFNKSSARANAINLATVGQQVSGAFQLARAENNAQTTIAGLVGGSYLRSAPVAPAFSAVPGTTAWVLDAANGLVTLEMDEAKAVDVCAEVLKLNGGQSLASGAQSGCVVTAG
ncbi:MAG: hypothetical protein K2X45_19935, partial [Phreatobacter sp.]|nr:hypothetical protein [Phreatobacter sp.]